MQLNALSNILHVLEQENKKNILRLLQFYIIWRKSWTSSIVGSCSCFSLMNSNKNRCCVHHACIGAPYATYASWSWNSDEKRVVIAHIDKTKCQRISWMRAHHCQRGKSNAWSRIDSNFQSLEKFCVVNVWCSISRCLVRHEGADWPNDELPCSS